MNITCPQCSFSRQQARDRLKQKKVIATCPQCGCRFRFSSEDGKTEILGPPLPPGAIIPGKNSGPVSQPDSIQTIGKDPDGPEGENGQPASQSGPAGSGDSRAAGGQEPKDSKEPDYSYPDPDEPADDWQAVAYTTSQERPAGIPWPPQAGGQGWLMAFYLTVTGIMFASHDFFASLARDSSRKAALLFFLIVCTIQNTADLFWAKILLPAVSSSISGDPQLSQLIELFGSEADPILSILIRTSLLVLQLYAYSALINLAYRLIVPDRADFSLVFQVLAYSAAPALLGIVPVLGSLCGLVWSIVCTAIGCRVALRLTWPQTLMGFVPILLLIIPMLSQVINLLRSVAI